MGVLFVVASLSFALSSISLANEPGQSSRRERDETTKGQIAIAIMRQEGWPQCRTRWRLPLDGLGLPNPMAPGAEPSPRFGTQVLLNDNLEAFNFQQWADISISPLVRSL